MSLFEACTLLALVMFAEEQVDYASVEVGLGGRLDATNVVVPEVADDHQCRNGPPGVSRQFTRGHRAREGRNHQAGRAGGDRRGAARRPGRAVRARRRRRCAVPPGGDVEARVRPAPGPAGDPVHAALGPLGRPGARDTAARRPPGHQRGSGDPGPGISRPPTRARYGARRALPRCGGPGGARSSAWANVSSSSTSRTTWQPWVRWSRILADLAPPRPPGRPCRHSRRQGLVPHAASAGGPGGPGRLHRPPARRPPAGSGIRARRRARWREACPSKSKRT